MESGVTYNGEMERLGSRLKTRSTKFDRLLPRLGNNLYETALILISMCAPFPK